MRLAQSCRGDAHEHCLRPQLFYVGASYISHSTAQSADHLEQDIADRTLVRHSAFDSLGDELLRGHLAFLEIAIGAAILHRAETAHPANHLEATTFQQQRFSGTLLSPRAPRSHHNT